MRCIQYIIIFIAVVFYGLPTRAQKNYASHYFSSTSAYNPALAGDTRFGQFNFINRLRPTVGNSQIVTTLMSYNQKVRNMNSGVGISVNREQSNFTETQVRINYSYTAYVRKKLWLKGGFGIGLNKLNTHANEYHFPDQYNHYGFNGLPSREPLITRKASYVSFALGGAVYTRAYWLAVSADNLNRPGYYLGDDITRVPFFFYSNGGYLFPLNKNKRPHRIISRSGGIEPYSSIGPVFNYIRTGPYNVLGIGLNTFMNPLFWGVQYRYNSYRKALFNYGISSLNFMGGYRNEFISISYSYDFVLKAQSSITKGAHEISLVYYLYSIKEDYRKHALLPYPNQLRY